MKNQRHAVNIKALHVFQTRHGRWMVYYRGVKPNKKLYSNKEKPTPGQVHDLWLAYITGDKPPPEPEPRHASGTWNAAIALWIDSSDYATKSPNTKKSYRAAIAWLRDKVGDMPMSKFTPYMTEKLLDKQRKAGKQGNDLLAVMRKVVRIATKLDWVTRDLLVDIHKKPAKDAGHYRPWEQWEIDAWRKTHPIGTMARFSFELAYHHALARVDLIRVGPQHLKNGEIAIARQKTGTMQRAPIDAELLACIAALPADHFGVVDMQGNSTRPWLRQKTGVNYTSDQMGNHWQEWRAEAGLPADFTIHGARSRLAIDGIHAGADVRDIMRMTGHTDMRVFEKHYAKLASDSIASARASRLVRALRKAG